MTRIDIDRRHVNFDLWRNFFKIEAADAVCVKTEASFEFNRNPLGILANFQREFFRAHCQTRRLRGDVRLNLVVHPHLVSRSFRQRIVGTRDVRVESSVFTFDWRTHPSLAKLVADGASSAKAERSLATLEVGHAHARKQHALKFLGRKRDWHANHGTENARLAKPMPEG